LRKILIKDHQSVKKNDVLMILQSTANYDDVLQLRKLMDSITPSQLFSLPINQTSNFRLGELQSDYNNFAKAFQDEKLFSRLQPYSPIISQPAKDCPNTAVGLQL
jgi:multidrug efflux pump subunit AcrA (membrane-fusion protein)